MSSSRSARRSARLKFPMHVLELLLISRKRHGLADTAARGAYIRCSISGVADPGLQFASRSPPTLRTLATSSVQTRRGMVGVLREILLAYKRTCAKEALVIRLSRPHERAYHCVIAERFTNTLIAYVVQHLLLGRLAAPQLNKHILWVPSRTLHELDAHLLKHHSCVVYVCACVCMCVYMWGGNVGCCSPSH